MSPDFLVYKLLPSFHALLAVLTKTAALKKSTLKNNSKGNNATIIKIYKTILRNFPTGELVNLTDRLSIV